MHRIKRATIHLTKWTVLLYALSLVVVALTASSLAYRGAYKSIERLPAVDYEEVTFTSEAPDALATTGWYFPGGSNQALVIAHGWGGNRSTLLTLAEYISTNDIAVLTYDARGGTGRNTYGDKETGDLAGAIAWLKTTHGFEPKQITLLGHSMGGAAATSYAAHNPVRGLILASSVYDLKKTRAVFARDYYLLTPSIYAWMVGVSERWVYGIQARNPKEDIVSVQSPILIVHGEDDAKAPVQDAVELADMTGVTVTTVPNGNHEYLIRNEEGKRVLKEAVLQFLLTLNN